ncbi:MAG: glycerol-3-phosphate acyltransferase, partial [Clostridia bacterium]|nr:glycerol-3-phosphate acyltransferase [Clostridia bacterium]
DVREKGSGNGGLTNMHRVYGKKAAALVLLGDMLKMALSLLLVGLFYGMGYNQFAFVTNPSLYIAGTACILGHIFPVFFKFKGGKGVLCTAVMALILSPIVFALLITVFILVVLVTKYISVGSMVAGLAYPVVLDRVLVFFGGVRDMRLTLLTILVALLIVFCHRGNIVRLLEKRENKFSFKKKK